MTLSTPARWMIIVLVSLGLQLCCCNFQSLLGCCHGEETASDVSTAHADGDHELSDAHAHCGHGGSHESSPEFHHGDQPSQPCNHDRGGGCSCGTHDKAPNLFAKINLEISPVVVAILPPPTLVWSSVETRALHYAELHAVGPPINSLLQQHCALNL